MRGRRGRDRMLDEFTTTYAISAYYHSNPNQVMCTQYNIM